MISLHNIATVARYEARILRRSWLFRLFALGALFILVGVNIGVVSPVGDENWLFLAIPSSIPYMNLYLLNIGQALIIVFLAADFLKKDKKLDTNEVLYTRSMSNLEYILGKSWGIIRLFMGINILILLIALVVNIIAKNTYVDILSYLWNILIVSLPTIIYSLGLAYIMMTLIKNQAITFLLLLGYAALNMFYLYFRGGGVFDYMLFGYPVFSSGMIGYDNIQLVLAHRLLYTLAGLAFILLSVLLFKRLPQSRTHRILSAILLVVSLGGAAWSAYYFYGNHTDALSMRENTLDINRKYEKKLFLTADRADITLDHSGKKLTASAVLKCVNNNSVPLDEIILSLNPGLEVTGISLGSSDEPFTRENHIITIDPTAPVYPGDTIEISIDYTGTINEAYCYPWYKGNLKDNEVRNGPVPLGQRQSFLYDDYVMLTSETNWYPVASLNFYPSTPAKIKVDFTEYHLSVKNQEGLTAISQGTGSQVNGHTYYTNSTRLPGISLVIGEYESDTIVVDSIEFTAWYKPGNDFFRNDLNEIGDTLPMLISNILTELETNFSTKYPFDKLKLVEVPVQFRSVDKKNTQTLAEVQASMILLPEKLSTIDDGAFYRTIKRSKRRMERNSQVVTDKELQVRAFNSFVRNSFISGSNFNFRNGQGSESPSRYLLGPSYYFFKNNFFSNEYPVINAVFESHLQKVEGRGNMARMFLGGLSESDKANTILRGTSFKDLLAMDPSNDTLRIVLTVKGDYIFNLLRAEIGIQKFNDWFSNYLEINKFRNISLDKLSSDIENEFGFSIGKNIDDWYNSSEQPGFYFTGITVKEIIVDNYTRYQVSFNATNEEETDGIFTVTFRTMGRGGRGGGGGGSVTVSMNRGGGGMMTFGGPGRGMQTTEVDKIVHLAAGQSKRINAILDAEPRAISINTLTSINNPGELMMPVEEVITDKRAEPVEEDIVLSTRPLFTEENEIIVDNEDPGFSYVELHSTGRLKDLLGISGEKRDSYGEMFSWWAPEYWQKTVQSQYYGKFIKSAHYTRSGAGERTASWTAKLDGPGYYNVYTWLAGGRAPGGPGGGPQGGGGNFEGRGGRTRNNPMQDLHYFIHHDAGSDEVTVEFENAENGWNHLGSYYFSGDSASVEISNLSEGRTVAADAIRWVKQK